MQTGRSAKERLSTLPNDVWDGNIFNPCCTHRHPACLSPMMIAVWLAAYRLVLEKLADDSAIKNMFGLDSLEAELFGQAPRPKSEWRVTFVDQGLDAVNAVRYSLEDGER